MSSEAVDYVKKPVQEVRQLPLHGASPLACGLTDAIGEGSSDDDRWSSLSSLCSLMTVPLPTLSTRSSLPIRCGS
jgi:hypothetical protein